MPTPSILIVTPALVDANNGNWRTAERWSRLLAPHATVRVARDWQGEPADLLIALHARRSAGAIARWHAAHGSARLVVALTGTDLYRDLPAGDADAARSLEQAGALVLLQERARDALPGAVRGKARVILQSTDAVRCDTPKRRERLDAVAIGHLRDEKDPLTLIAALQRLPATLPLRLVHVGAPLQTDLADAARAATNALPNYRWIGARPAAATRRRLAAARLLVHVSRMEGGANVVGEALRSGVPVLASRIDGNVGLLGEDYDGYVPPGDADALAAALRRCVEQPAFLARIEAQCATREALFDPAREAAALARLVDDRLAARE